MENTYDKIQHLFVILKKYSVQFSSVAQSCLTPCDPMNRSTPGLPVHHQLPEFTQTRVHGVGDAIQSSHPLSSLSPPAPNPSQNQGLQQTTNRRELSQHSKSIYIKFTATIKNNGKRLDISPQRTG